MKYLKFVIILVISIPLLFASNKAYATILPSDILNEEWGIWAVEAPKVWSMGIMGKGILVAVIDTGVDNANDDLKGNLTTGYNAFSGGEDTDDTNGHGNTVACLIAGNGKGLGFKGVAPEANIMPVKVFDSSGYGDVKNVQLGIHWAADNGAKIINLSSSSANFDDSVFEAVRYAQTKGCLVVASTGNHTNYERSDILFPAYIPGVIAVGGLTKEYEIATFSNMGNSLDLVAPGSQILTVGVGIDNSPQYTFIDGTSMAAAFVSGVAALVWSAHPDWSAQQVASIIEQSAQRLDANGRTPNCGYGLANAYRAIRVAADPQEFLNSAEIDYDGGIIKDLLNGSSLSVAPLTWDSVNRVSLQSVEQPAEFPSGITTGSSTVQVSWDTLEAPQRIIYLTIPVINQLNEPNYVFKWSGTRWIRVAGGDNGKTLTVGIYDQGIYCIGKMSLGMSENFMSDDPIEMAIQTAEAAYPTGTDNIFIALSEDFPDSVTAVPLAYKYSAPILLISRTEFLDPRVKMEIQHLAPKAIYILGGTAVVSSVIESELSQFANVKRFAGINKYETASLIAEALGTIGRTFIASGEDFPDAISIASIAARQGVPILLTEKDCLSTETLNALNSLWITDTIIVGGNAVVSEIVKDQLSESKRLWGEDRYATNLVVRNAFSSGTSDIITSGEDFHRALMLSIKASINYINIHFVNTKDPSPTDNFRRVGARDLILLC